MIHPPSAKASAKGGSVTSSESPAKAASLAALHASRRGVRVHPWPASLASRWARVRQLRAEWSRAVWGEGCRTVDLAAACGVQRKTVWRWLSGRHIPAPKYQPAVDAWSRAIIARAARLTREYHSRPQI